MIPTRAREPSLATTVSMGRRAAMAARLCPDGLLVMEGMLAPQPGWKAGPRASRRCGGLAACRGTTPRR